MSITKEIIKECYWDAHMTPQDLENIVASKDNRELEKLFSKIIYNSKDKLRALKLFSKEQLVYLFSNFKATYNKKYIEKHILVLRVLLLDEKHEIKGLEWKKIAYKTLYKLQDEILNIVFALENDFYLTGGTALHRFYYNGRYSDDLDFFVSNSQTFSEDINEIIESLKEQNYQISQVVNSRDFHRVIVNDLLQLDFVNDRVYRYKKSNLVNNFRIDNKINILTNKLTTIISRDEEKDIFDLFYIAFHETFNWTLILEIANKKSIIETDILLYRLKSFPLKWLDRIKKVENLEITESDIERLSLDIVSGQDNSLYQKGQ